MSKKLIINIEEYCTQSEYSKLTGIKLNTISQQIKRAKEGIGGSNGIDYKEYPELNNLILVRRPQQ